MKKTKGRGRVKGSYTSPIAYYLLTVPIGDYFFVDRENDAITGMAHYHKIKVSCEKCYAVTARHGELYFLTKVTVLDRPEKSSLSLVEVTELVHE